MYYSAFVCGGALTAWLTDVFLIVLGQHQSSVVRWGQDTQTTLVTRISSSLVWVFSQALLTLRKKTQNIGGLSNTQTSSVLQFVCELTMCFHYVCVCVCVCRWVSNHMNKYGHGDSPGFVDCADV